MMSPLRTLANDVTKRAKRGRKKAVSEAPRVLGSMKPGAGSKGQTPEFRDDGNPQPSGRIRKIRS